MNSGIYVAILTEVVAWRCIDKLWEDAADQKPAKQFPRKANTESDISDSLFQCNCEMFYVYTSDI